MHLLHTLIAKIILETDLPDCEVILGNDCGGDQYIQLFCNDRGTRASRFCSIDAMIVQKGNAKVLVEIEESDIRPVALCGKVFVAAHSSHFIHKGKAFPIAPSASFVQVIDTKNLSERSSKLDQCRYLRGAICNTLSKNGTIRDYEIFHGDIAEFERLEAQQELRDHLCTTCFHFDATRACPQFSLERRD